MKVSAIACDDETCNDVVRVENATVNGWLSIGGERRGRSRLDLCPHHAMQAIRIIQNAQQKARKKT